MPDTERQSVADAASLITDPDAKAKAEARNALRQFDMVSQMINEWLRGDRQFRLRPSMVLGLHRAALEGISAYAGNFRPAGVDIKGSQHQPPGAHLVAELVEEMCEYVNAHWEDRTALHLSAYVMWKLNWIHPFSDGNGRTSRALAYLVLCVRLGSHLPGINTIPEQIAENKAPYYKALEAADEAFRNGNVDLTALEELLESYLARQLVTIHQHAGGQADPPGDIRLH